MEVQEENRGTLRCTYATDGIDEYVIDTCDLEDVGMEYGGSAFVSFIDALSGHSGRRFETLVEMNGEWLNFTQTTTDNPDEALRNHERILEKVAAGRVEDAIGNEREPGSFLWDRDSVARLRRPRIDLTSGAPVEEGEDHE